MPFKPSELSPDLIKKLKNFLHENDLSEFYKQYVWENDTYSEGFVDIKKLELQLRKNERSTGITLDDAKAVAKWGAMRNQSRISGTALVLPPNTLTDTSGNIQACVEMQPQAPISILKLIDGFGPTYQTKILRFTLPEEYGAIDTRIVRVFGNGDTASKKHDWLELKATLSTFNKKPAGWFISATQKSWPNDFSRWINILRYFAQNIEYECPHPEDFVKIGLRTKGEWTCADVEMALFCYASGRIKNLIPQCIIK